MSDNARVAEAMGWEKITERPFSPRWIRLIDEGRPAPTGASITHIYEGEAYAEVFGSPPDYVTDSALLSEMLEWLAERYFVDIEGPILGGPWTLYLYGDGDLLYDDYAEESVNVQKAIARCVCWALEQEQ